MRKRETEQWPSRFACAGTDQFTGLIILRVYTVFIRDHILLQNGK
jgi:hypothetical protein